LASIHGSVELSERIVHPDEIGRSLSEIATGLGVQIYRNGVPHGHKAPEARTLLAGDTILEIIAR
ncbi:hypothetical protein, partial [Escherichia coli]